MPNSKTQDPPATERRRNLGTTQKSMDKESRSPMSPADNEKDQITHQNYSGKFTVTSPGGNQIIGNQYAKRDLNNNTWPSQHWSETNHSRPAPQLPSRTMYFARALDDFQPTCANELCFKTGDIIELTQGNIPNRDGWYMGRVIGRREEEGLVPKDYVELMD